MATRRSELQTRSHTSREVWHPSSDISAGVRSTWGFPRPSTFRPWAFSTLRRFAPPSSEPVLFRTGTTYGVQRAGTDSPGNMVRLGQAAPKSQSTWVAPRVDNSSDRGHSSSMSLVCGGVWSINRVCLLATLPTCHSPTPMRTKALGGGPVGGPSESLLDYHDAPCVVARGQHTPSSEPAMQKRLTFLWLVDFFCALRRVDSRLPPEGRRVESGRAMSPRLIQLAAYCGD
jgi:hypothetical protein